MSFEHAELDSDLTVTQIKSPEKTNWDLNSAKVKLLKNDEASWPSQDRLSIDGMTVTELKAKEGLNAERQLRWLKRESRGEFESQPYEQTALVFREMGLQDDALKVLIAKNLSAGNYAIVSDLMKVYRYTLKLGTVTPWQLFKSAEYHWKMFWNGCKALWAIVWYWGFGWLIGYGYRPWRALLPSVVIILLGQGIFKAGHDKEIMIPAKDDAWITDATGRKILKSEFPKFSPFIYSLEKFVPLVKLDMGDYWGPNTDSKEGRTLRRYLWCHIIAGWVLTSLWAASLTGLLKS